MPKIANIIEDARLGGPQVRIAEVAKRLKGNEYETTVIIPKKDNKRFKTRLEEYGVKYKELSLHRLTKEPKHLVLFVLLFFYELFVLYRYLKKENFDVLHVSGGSWQWKGVLAGKLARCKVLWHLNDTKMPSYIKLFFKPLAKCCVDGFIVAGSRVKSYYLDELKINKEIIHEIQAPVDCEVFDPQKVQSDPKMDSYDGLKVVTVANVNPVKGLETFIRMVNEINKQAAQKVSFVIVGSINNNQKSYYDYLNSLKEKYNIENLYFYGVSNDVKSILKSTDIYVCSSIAECSPVSLWEAMDMKKAVVSTDVGDVSRFISDGKNGYIVNVGDYEQLANQIGVLIENINIRERYGKEARKVVRNNLDISTVAEQHQITYKEAEKV